jgi:putative endonuclease
MAKHNDLGKLGEQIALAYLKSNNYEIVESNWKYNHAEIDIIAIIKQQIIFIEVKTRTGSFGGYPEHFVDAKKEKLYALAADEYIYQVNHQGECRFDIIAITFENQTKYHLHHIEDAFFPT